MARMQCCRAALVAAAVTSSWASGAFAQGASEQKKAEQKKVKSEHVETDDPATSEDGPAHKGMQAYVDSDTGRLRKPTPAEEQKLAEELAKIVNDSPEGLTAVSGADGTIAVDLEERFMNFSIATEGSDGAIALGCATSLRSTLELMLRDPATRKPVVTVVPGKPQPEKKEALDVR